MKAFTCAAGLLIAALAPWSAAAQAPEIDPRAVEIVTAAAGFIAGQPRIALDWSVEYDEVIRGREKITHLRSGRNLLARGEGFYAYAEDGRATREYFFDGAQVTIAIDDAGAYASAPFAGSFEAMVDRLGEVYGLAIPIWEMLSAKSPEDLLDGVEAAAYLGIVRVDGRPAHHLAFATEDQDWQIWVSTDAQAPTPLLLIGTNPYAQGWPQYRARFLAWDFAPEIPPDRFAFAPGDGDIRMAWPQTAAGLGAPPVSATQ